MAKQKSAVPRLEGRHRKAAALLANGLSVSEVARQIGCGEETVLAWMRNPAVMKLYHQKLDGSKVVSYARAVRRIAGQMEDENPMVVLRAAKEALEKFEGATSMGESGVTVRVEGMPALGMPHLAEEMEE